MDDIMSNTSGYHIGRKIERVRRLRGMNQTELGKALGITKQAISKMEQAERIEDDRLKAVANALGVTEEGLKGFSEEKVLYNTINFYENCGVVANAISANTETFDNFPVDKAIEFFEKLLEAQNGKIKAMKDNK